MCGSDAEQAITTAGAVPGTEGGSERIERIARLRLEDGLVARRCGSRGRRAADGELDDRAVRRLRSHVRSVVGGGGCGRTVAPPRALIAPVPLSDDREALTATLSRAGFIAAEEEAAELLACAAGDLDVLGSMVRRRLTGEPLAWITGSTVFCGLEIHVDPGVYVPRWQSEALAHRAAQRLPAGGTAVDICTGAGPIAMTLAAGDPGARVVASDIDERAVGCARANGVDVYHGDLFAPLPATLQGQVDVVVGVVPYVPTTALPMLQRDTFAFESALSYDGGDDGADILRRVMAEGTRFLRPGGALLLELGGDQAEVLRADLAQLGYVDVMVIVDEDGDVRGIESTLDLSRTR